MITLLLLLPLAGCSYLEERGRDLSQCARGRVAFGVGLYAELEATELMHPAVGFMDMTLVPRASLGWDPRPEPTFGQVRTAAMPTLLVAWPYYGWHESQAGYGTTRPYLRGFLAPWILMGNHHVRGDSCAVLALDRLIPNPRLAPRDGDTEPQRDLVSQTWLAASATALFVNVEVGVQSIEMLDFVLGWFGVDVLGDDGLRVVPEPVPVPVPVPETAQ